MLSPRTFSPGARLGRVTLGLSLAACLTAHAQEPSTAEIVPSTANTAPDEPAAVSQVRIVRLSQVRGSVQMDRNTGRGFENAFANIPVVAGAQLRTQQGIAEVEFEDNSSLRLTPDTEVHFAELGRAADGTTLTGITVVKGLVYADVEKTKGNHFTLTDGAAHLVLAPGTHLRFDASQSPVQLAIFTGEAALTLNSSNSTLGKHESVTLDLDSGTVYAPQHGFAETAYDGWDKQESGYHQQKAGLAGSGGVGLFGANDLNYYGSFSDAGGCGSLWRPYFTSAAWDPFASGVWAWYPNAGYSWVSPYPWGWLPFHSGSWVSCGAAGWGWSPGGAGVGNWYGLNNTTAMRLAHHPVHTLPMPPVPHAGATFVPVNMHQLHPSGATGEDFTFRRDSAGLGVPRSTFGNLHAFAGTVARQGTATASSSASTAYSSNTSSAPRSSAGLASPQHSSSPSFSSAGGHGSFSAPSSGGSASSASAGASSGGSHK